MVTVSGNPYPTYPTNPTNPTNPTTKYHCEFVNLFCIYAVIIYGFFPVINCLSSQHSTSTDNRITGYAILSLYLVGLVWGGE